MRTRLLSLAFAAVAVSFWLAARVTQSLPGMVGPKGSQTRMLLAGHRGPVVVLDCFGAAPLEYWGTIQRRCAEFSRVVTYDHRGEWGSDPGPKPRDARQIATELHAMLHAAKLEPPYVLVGYSFGGPYVRVFAGLFPEEVSGLTLVDPSQEEFFDWLKVHHPELNRITPDQEAEQSEIGCTWASLNQARASKVPAVPIALITTMRSYEKQAYKPQWLEAHQQWLSRIPGAEHIITERSSHGIVLEEPDLVVNTIRRTVDRASVPSGGR